MNHYCFNSHWKKKANCSLSGMEQVSSSDPPQSYESFLGFPMVLHLILLTTPIICVTTSTLPALWELLPPQLPCDPWRPGWLEAIISQLWKTKSFWMLPTLQQTGWQHAQKGSTRSSPSPQKHDKSSRDQIQDYLVWNRNTTRVAARWCWNKVGHLNLRAFGKDTEVKSELNDSKANHYMLLVYAHVLWCHSWVPLTTWIPRG
jgi:hypothetical protein